MLLEFEFERDVRIQTLEKGEGKSKAVQMI